MAKILETSYNFHDLVTMRITRQRSFCDATAASMLDLVFNHYTCNRIESPDVELRIGSFAPDLSGCYLVDRRYHVRDDFIAYASSYKGGRWFTEIHGIESGNVRIRVCSNTLGHLAYSPIAPRGMLMVAFMRRGMLPVHGGAVANDDRGGVLFSARSGVGKTVTAISLTKRGFKLLGDDYTLVKNGRMYSLALPFNLRFSYDPEALHGREFPASLRRQLFLKKLLSYATLGNVNLLTKVPIRDVFPDGLVDSAPLSRLYLLNHGNRFGYEDDLSEDEVVRAIEANMWFEFDELRKLLMAYGTSAPGSWAAGFQEELRRLIRRNIRSVPCARIRIPIVYDESTIEKLAERVIEDLDGHYNAEHS